MKLTCLEHDAEHGAEPEVDQGQALLQRASDDGTDRLREPVPCSSCSTPYAVSAACCS